MNCVTKINGINDSLCQVMKGYFKNEEATKDMIDSDGWLRTGDIVKYDTDEFFYIEGRVKEIIKTKGFQARKQ
jgi:long-subunit acyl-CoA synthetase (AMP-forming)